MWVCMGVCVHLLGRRSFACSACSCQGETRRSIYMCVAVNVVGVSSLVDLVLGDPVSPIKEQSAPLMAAAAAGTLRRVLTMLGCVQTSYCLRPRRLEARVSPQSKQHRAGHASATATATSTTIGSA